MARAESVPVGLSTLQRWAFKWKELHVQSPVKSVLWIAGNTKTYFLDREDFRVWLFEKKQNLRPSETLRDPEGPPEVPQDLKRPQETSEDSVRPQRQDDENIILKLRDDNMNLKIDLEVRKQLLNQARDEIERVRSHTENLLRENGELQFQVRQLAGAKEHERLEPPTSQEQS
jgi:hypothetical protein